MHARQQIREAVVTALSGNVSATVIDSRIWTLQTDELPLVGVYTASESDSLDEGGASMGSPVLFRELELVAELAVIGASGKVSADALDSLAEQVEAEMPREPAGALDVLPGSWEVEQSPEGEQIISRAVMTFICQYRTAAGVAGVLL